MIDNKNKFEIVIGLEIHIEMKTKSKLFSSSPVNYNSEPNTLTTPYDLAFPGTLPIPNKQAIIYAIQMCNALHMKIDNHLSFDRKNYFYSDLPKGYQITQQKNPIGKNGFLIINEKEKIKIKRLHIEEDTAKQLHFKNFTLVDYNRAGIPLLEIVTYPCIHSSDTTIKFLELIRETAIFLGINDGKMEKGQLRCDVNISVKKKNNNKLGTKVEIKNVNSFSHIKNAISYEIDRQIKLLNNNKKIIQETRQYDDKNKKTKTIRLKIDTIDYKYFTEPNIVPIKLSKEFINAAIKNSNELSIDKRKRYSEKYKLNDYDINLLLSNVSTVKYFEQCILYSKYYKTIVNWINGEIMAFIKKKLIKIENFIISPKTLAILINDIQNNNISNKLGREIFYYMINNNIDDFYKAKNSLGIEKQESNYDIIEKIVIETLKINKQAIVDYHNGKNRAFGFLMGQIIKKSNGKINPNIANKILIKELKKYII